MAMRCRQQNRFQETMIDPNFLSAPDPDFNFQLLHIDASPKRRCSTAVLCISSQFSPTNLPPLLIVQLQSIGLFSPLRS